MAVIQNAIMQIQDAMGAMSGIKAAPDYVPEAEGQFPFIIAYEGPGTWELSAGCKRWIGEIIVELHIARKDMPRDVKQVAYYSDLIPNEILDEFKTDLLGNTIEAITSIVTSGMVFLQYYAPNGIGDHIGIIYRVNCKLISTIT